MSKNKRIKRIKNPIDKLFKLVFLYFEKELHEYLGLPGKFLYKCPNEYPRPDGDARVDRSYMIEYLNNKYIVDLEDESSHYITKKILEKNLKYSENIQLLLRLLVISVINTDAQLKDCIKEIEISPTLLFKPIINSLKI